MKERHYQKTAFTQTTPALPAHLKHTNGTQADSPSLHAKPSSKIFKENPMKTLASIMLLFSLSAMATPSFAMGTALKQTSQLQVKSAPKTTRPSFELKKTNYKRTKYPNVRLLGPIDFSIEEDYSVRRFRNVTASRAQLVSDPNISKNFETDQYYKATVAKASFKFKF